MAFVSDFTLHVSIRRLVIGRLMNDELEGIWTFLNRGKKPPELRISGALTEIRTEDVRNMSPDS
jgi:hypothetical protein